MKRLVWVRGYDWGIKQGYKTLRDNRIIAMAFEAGWKASRKAAQNNPAGKEDSK